jgi:hypothetical protein
LIDVGGEHLCACHFRGPGAAEAHAVHAATDGQAQPTSSPVA